jgi:hypothetical protein
MLCRFNRIAAVLLLIVGLGLPSAFGQENSLNGVVPRRTKYKHKIRIKEEYDRFKDQVSVNTKFELPLGLRGFVGMAQIWMVALYNTKGEVPAVPDTVAMGFETQTEGWVHLRGAKVIALADSERIDLGHFKSIQSEVLYAGRVMEVIGASVPLADFLKIANAKKVLMRIGGTEIKLKDDHLEALRDFASRMRSSSSDQHLVFKESGESSGSSSAPSVSENGRNVQPSPSSSNNEFKNGIVSKPSGSNSLETDQAQSLKSKVKFTLESNPNGAVIEVDDIEIGVTPKTINMTPGKHKIRLSLSGFEPWERNVDVIEGILTLRLSPLPK